MNRPAAKILAVAAGFFFLFFLAVPFFAGGTEATGSLNDDLIDLAKRVLNFGLLLIILFVAVKKMGLKNFLAARTEEIRQHLAETKKNRAQAEEKYRLLEEKFKAFAEQSRLIAEQFRAEGTAAKEKILAEARQKAQQITDQAEWVVRQEARAAQERLREEVSRRIIRKAEALIAAQLTDRDQDRLVDDFMERIGKPQC